MLGMGMGELIVVFMIILLLFGANKLPEMAQALGKSVREFKKAANEIRSEAQAEPALVKMTGEVKPEKSSAV